jgi:hypothetical protein
VVSRARTLTCRASPGFGLCFACGDGDEDDDDDERWHYSFVWICANSVVASSSFGLSFNARV